MENGQEMVQSREVTNDALAEQLASVIAQDKENRIHTDVVRLGYDSTQDRPTRLHEGYLVTATADNRKHLFLLDTPRGKKVIVISPRNGHGVEAPGVENPEDLAAYLKHLHYDPDPQQQKYTSPYEYSLAYTTKGGVTTNLPGHFFREEMLLADSSTQTAASVRRAMKEAIAYGSSKRTQNAVLSDNQSVSVASGPQAK